MTRRRPGAVASVGDGGAESAVVEITMANTARRNSLGPQMLDELAAALAEARTRGPRGDHPGGAWRSTWSAGYDIAELPTDGSDPLTWTNPLEAFLHGCARRPSR